MTLTRTPLKSPARRPSQPLDASPRTPSVFSIRASDCRPVRNAFSLIEVIVTMTILGILVAFAAPRFTRTMEQSHADLAGAGLRAINTAQRFYWLKHRTYAPTLQALRDEELIDEDLIRTTSRYEYVIASADASGFTAEAIRRGFDSAGQPTYEGAWQGAFTVDETGAIGGSVQPATSDAGSSATLVPGI